ncbi:MAG: HAMP domain-containing protein [Candidatus Koribacter versatilis]|uniref:histidine kinase n=1 Tax=Candidatus Korobacter versatilis TaxID=658062 RepID=A0A932A733_9BACT|nr:HAMP domain-containing protein [Candidatus Koribacter versatilis]
MASTPQNPKSSGRRMTGVIILLVVVVLLFLALASQTAFNLTFLRPETSEQTLLFTALSALIFLVFVALTFVLGRNLLKLYAERRTGVLGSKFRTRMVVGALLLSFLPVIFLFQFAYLLMNRSIEKWFSGPVEELREESGRVATMMARYAADNARSEADAIASTPEVRRAFATGNYSAVLAEFHRHQQTLQGGFAVATVADDSVASLGLPQPWGVLRSKLRAAAEAHGKQLPAFMLGDKEYILGAASIEDGGRIIVAIPLPAQFSSTLSEIEQTQRRYFELAQQRKQVRRTYIGFLLLLTVLVLFAATWLALFLSKQVTRPVSALAEATDQISKGNLTYRVDVPAANELGDLVASFNRMATELESNRKQIEASTRDVEDANVELEQRRRQIETILESIPTGVLSLNDDKRVTRTNHVFLRIFGAAKVATGSTLRDLFPPEVVDDIEHMLRKADRMGTSSSQMEIAGARGRVHVSLTVASLQLERQRLGYVLVFEDLSDLLKAQKQAAWREVARRVAHEIKNPLTPIALSAERIRRHLERGAIPDEESIAVIHGCAETIAGAIETVRTLVDEFSTLARFPASQPEPADINAVIEGALALFNGRLDGIAVRTELDRSLPKVLADPEAIRRAIANLVDNAAEAMQESLLREVHISTALLGNRDAVEIVVADTGHGVTRELKEKLFLPYFSTKKRGTGLGLAIVSRIIEDHHGSIRVEENLPVGARFIVELPVASESEAHLPPEDPAKTSHAQHPDR